MEKDIAPVRSPALSHVRPLRIQPRRGVIITSTIDDKKTTAWGESGFRPHFQRDAACARGKAWHGVDVQRVGGTPWKAYAGGTGVPPMRNAQMTIPFMIATGTNEMRTTAKARRVDV